MNAATEERIMLAWTSVYRRLIERNTGNFSVFNYLLRGLIRGLTRYAHQADKHFFTRRWHRSSVVNLSINQTIKQMNIKHCYVTLNASRHHVDCCLRKYVNAIDFTSEHQWLDDFSCLRMNLVIFWAKDAREVNR